MHYRPMPQFEDVDIRRFWSQVDQADPDTCWPWKLSAFTGGYGQFKMSFYQQIWNLRSHRVAYYLHYGIDPRDKLVCHSCDNPTCCNPYHLFLGTEGDNIQDAKSKNRLKPRSGDAHGSKTHPERWARGERVAGSRLSTDDVKRIRDLYRARSHTQQQIADLYNVDRQTVGKIIRAENWQHVSSLDPQVSLSERSRKGLPGNHNPGSVLEEHDVIRIRELYSTGAVSYRDLAKIYGVTVRTIANIVKRLNWRHLP